MGLDPKRTVTELEELRELTGDENGAQRVAWTDTWRAAREWLRDGADVERRVAAHRKCSRELVRLGCSRTLGSVFLPGVRRVSGRRRRDPRDDRRRGDARGTRRL